MAIVVVVWRHPYGIIVVVQQKDGAGGAGDRGRNGKQKVPLHKPIKFHFFGNITRMMIVQCSLGCQKEEVNEGKEKSPIMQVATRAWPPGAVVLLVVGRLLKLAGALRDSSRITSILYRLFCNNNNKQFRYRKCSHNSKRSDLVITIKYTRLSA